MDGPTIATMVAAGIAAAAALLSAWYAQRSERARHASAAEDLASRFREPLLQSAFNLQTRIYNIVRMNFFAKFAGDAARPSDRSYTLDNTLYLIGQYLCWVEILRRESQFLDPRSQARERAVADQLERVRDALASSTVGGPELRIFRGQQRAIGEMLLIPAAGSAPGWPKWDCMGYAQFVEQQGLERVARWFAPLRLDLEQLSGDPSPARARLTMVQHELLRLVELLDPEASRTSGRLRERL
ncbi:hypothetical protein [Humibacillus xanthopallidus]|uniref:Uncharacterized protein n=1 Tax=Humibacillus xanthopallidus TaxID=412689 RepID=A0A543HUB6_9MICO|nr:hypothetical protein [Humibacillus xanthopallidus]TQM61957.1 hypothetical protein FBY41_1979 [Humibacillus xanthopallidus]